MTERNSAQEQALNKPFGFEQGDPLIVCINAEHMKSVIKALGIRAYYVETWGDSVLGYRFGKAIIFRPRIESVTQLNSFDRWIKHSVQTSLGPGGEVYFV